MTQGQDSPSDATTATGSRLPRRTARLHPALHGGRSTSDLEVAIASYAELSALVYWKEFSTPRHAARSARQAVIRDCRTRSGRISRMNTTLTEPAAQPGFTWPVRVYFEDTDAGGIVFYANYLKFFERARTEWLRACGIDQRQLADTRQLMFVVHSTAVDYRAPARLDDLLTIESRIERLGRASVDFHQQAYCNGKVLTRGAIRVACVEHATIRLAPLPDTVRQALLTGPRDTGLSTVAR
ncbi:hypothetical protein DFQ28_004408 [Apophysomyces sp. BC1034]|nr:hypothetical protein DFQ28_004408 [Apophysomyces sp. BC1034]